MVERTEDGKFHPYVMDFGLARDTESSENTRSSVIEGTPRFMSPEQARGDMKHLDRRTDVYSLGITLYEMLVGQSPFKGAADVDILVAVLTTEPRPLRSIDSSVPVDLEAITLKCIEKDQAARYDSAKALAEDLGRYLDGDTVEARHIGIVQRLYRRARKHKAIVAAGAVLLLIIMGLSSYGIRARVLAQRTQRESKEQAELAQRLGQQIKDMEWLMRSARQLPLHDLEREKVIVRRRMQKLEAELRTHGELGRGLAHYALGRGHLALQEYKEAQAQLEQALAYGQKGAEVYYALGLVLDHLFYSETVDVLLDAGSIADVDKLLVPKYLAPALAALQRSRELELDAPAYLEGLIAYSQKDFPAAQKYATMALEQAPWLYEASQLLGNIHRTLANQNAQGGKYEEAAQEAATAMNHYQAAARIGQSDAEVYDSLVTLLREEMERAIFRGKTTEGTYAAVLAALDKMATIEPKSAQPPMLKSMVIMISLMELQNAGRPLPEERLQACIRNAEEAFAKQPGLATTRNAAANCYETAALSPNAGDKAEAYFQKAIGFLRPLVDKHPRFFVGTVNLAEMYALLARHQTLLGRPEAASSLATAERYATQSELLDSTMQVPLLMSLLALEARAPLAGSAKEVGEILAKADALLAKCKAMNEKNPTPYANHFSIHVSAAWRLYLAGQDPRPTLKRATESLEASRKLSGFMITLEQQAAVSHLMAAAMRVRDGEDPAPALTEAAASVKRCLDSSGSDARCHASAARASFILADWLTLRQKPSAQILEVLDRAREQAAAATQSVELYPDAWQVLAEAQLRIAQAKLKQRVVRDEAIHAGLASVDKALAKNPQHALARTTQGRLLLLRAETQDDPEVRRLALKSAASAFEQALRIDPLLTHDYAPLLAQARAGSVH